MCHAGILSEPVLILSSLLVCWISSSSADGSNPVKQFRKIQFIHVYPSVSQGSGSPDPLGLDQSTQIYFTHQLVTGLILPTQKMFWVGSLQVVIEGIYKYTIQFTSSPSSSGTQKFMIKKNVSSDGVLLALGRPSSCSVLLSPQVCGSSSAPLVQSFRVKQPQPLIHRSYLPWCLF